MRQTHAKSAELEQILGTEYRGVLSSDDFSAEPETLRLRSITDTVWWRNRSVAAHIRRHFLRLIQQPGIDFSTIGNVFVDLIDDAFQNYSRFQDLGDSAEYTIWANENKIEVTQCT